MEEIPGRFTLGGALGEGREENVKQVVGGPQDVDMFYGQQCFLSQRECDMDSFQQGNLTI